MRWRILALLFLSTLFTYLDRQALGVLRPEIAREFGLTNAGYSFLTAAFMAPYVIMYVLGGRIVDRWGSGIGLKLFMALWSTTTLLTGWVSQFWQLGVTRFFLGVAEPGNIPAAMRAVTSWFPSKERGLAVAVFSAGSALGAILAPPLVAAITSRYGWRSAFVALGAMGTIWLIVWTLTYREPHAEKGPRAKPATIRALLGNRSLRGVILARLVSDPVWYVMLFWLPSFFRDQHHLSLASYGAIGWIPFLVADVGGIGGSCLADSLIRAGGSPIASRVRVLRWAAWLGPLTFALIWPLPTAVALGIFAFIGAMCLTWFFGTAALVGELLPKEQVAGAMGIVGAAGALGGLLVNAVIGPTIDWLGFGPTLALLALLHPIAAMILRSAIRAPGNQENRRSTKICT
jgi:ACS family hexuronate transporter-like MFS transporter